MAEPHASEVGDVEVLSETQRRLLRFRPRGPVKPARVHGELGCERGGYRDELRREIKLIEKCTASIGYSSGYCSREKKEWSLYWD